ncbi:septal ring lytic transglycosylase RlpA family protein [Aeromonas veronii]|uniref:septal ring lytic transglycosylase RlpA family protein n=1 Tax=Aeromonas veronii TaxID=654 RepID=UPI00214E3010|nr:septal ring lytic transglycosylase RlpA family protein [Aeromonas veronii]MCR3957448.1 septal ring lytic transglycosylase RlpA family protein [Aeromonas veronii]
MGREGVVQSACKGGLLFVCLLLAACSSRYDESHGGSWRGYSETGYASYYADRYHGKKTASGELYRNNLNSAAHMELPFGSMVRVTNLANGKSVVVKVNDRGAFKSGRIIDLSKSAFGSIANIRDGLIKVKVEVL